MKTKLAVFSTLAVLFLLVASGSVTAQSSGTARATPLGSAFTYQGRLSFGGAPASGAYDFQFYLFDASSGGSQVGPMIPVDDLVLTDGYFSVQLDFGAGIFNGQRRYLEVRLRPGSETGAFSVLDPRQELTSAPGALYALSAPWSGLTGIPAGFADGIDNDTLYTAGTGLGLSGTTFSADTAYLQRRVSASCAAGNAIRVINADGTVTCEADDDTTYTAGTGLTLSSGQFSLTASYRLPQACATNQIPKWNGSAWICAADETGIAGSSWSLTGNVGTNPTTNYLGTSDNQALEIRVNGLRALRLEPGAYSTINVIAGYSGNTVTAGIYGATISGGGASGIINRVTDGDGTIGGGIFNTVGNNNADLNDASDATVSGGSGNIASGYSSTVGGGATNTASGYGASIGAGMNNTATGWMSRVGGGWMNDANSNGASVGGGTHNLAEAAYATISGGGPLDPNSAFTTDNRVFDDYGTIGGGANNRAGSDDSNTTTAQFATVGGGRINQATGPSSTVGGGWVNTASGNASTVPGGANNEATGAYSFAAGADGHATHDGSFVWSSASRTDSWGVQTFTVRAPGGVRFYSAAGTTTGTVLPAGGGSFASLSDRASKENFSPVNDQALLAKVASLPVSTWNYKSQDQSILHIGPMAQDFYAAFGVGEDQKYISSIDADGVALAAIQGLYQQNQQQAAEIQSLKARLSSLEAGIPSSSGNPGKMVRAPVLLWALIALLAVSQMGMFVLLRRKAGRA